jgi:hypothetical protein
LSISGISEEERLAKVLVNLDGRLITKAEVVVLVAAVDTEWVVRRKTAQACGAKAATPWDLQVAATAARASLEVLIVDKNMLDQ